MAEIYTCKCCGASLTVSADGKTGVCEFCGTRVVFPKAGFKGMNRANELRQRREFDQAEAIYRSLTIAFPDDPEIWWNILLCEYGIEYVQEADRRVPTINRMKYEPLTEQEAYRKAIALSDAETAAIYRAEGQVIADIQTRLQTIVAQEDPYDVFICFKDRDDATGERTLDSALAQDVYDALTKEGYRVFFSRISLRTAVGQEFEPRIFAALNSAKMMILVACAPEHVGADWVKNEWSRYLKLMSRDADRYLLPIYADMKPEEFPPRLAALEGIEVNGANYMDLIVKNVADRIGRRREDPALARFGDLSDIEADENRRITQRGFAAIANERWENAAEYFDQVLSRDGCLADAWWGKLAVKTRNFKSTDDFRSDPEAEACYQKAMEYADGVQKERYSADLRRYDFERMLHDFMTKTSKMTRVWSESTPGRDSATHLELVEQQKKILELADESRKAELTGQFDAYNQKQARVQALKREYVEIEAENQRIEERKKDLIKTIKRLKETRKKAVDVYPVKLMWFLAFLTLTYLVGLGFLIAAVIRHNKRNAMCREECGFDFGEMKYEIKENQERLEEAEKAAAERIKALPDEYDRLKKKYEDVQSYVLPRNLQAHIAEWTRRMQDNEKR